MDTRDRIAQSRDRDAVAGAVLAAAPRFGPGIELRSLIAAARQRLKPMEAAGFDRNVRTTTLALEQSWRLARVRGAQPARWRRLDSDDRLRFSESVDDGNRWPPL